LWRYHTWQCRHRRDWGRTNFQWWWRWSEFSCRIRRKWRRESRVSRGGSGNTGGTSGSTGFAPITGLSLFFSDLTSGSNSGGQSDKGAHVTVFGNGFGDTQGTSTVTIGGGAADNYPIWTNSKITFQLGGGAKTGAVVVHVPGKGDSNALPFYRARGRDLFRHCKRQRLERRQLRQSLEDDSQGEEHHLGRGHRLPGQERRRHARANRGGFFIPLSLRARHEYQRRRQFGNRRCAEGFSGLSRGQRHHRRGFRC